MLATIKHLIQHPIAGRRPVVAVARYAAWQMRLRVQRETHYGWIDGALLLVRSSGGPANGNVYCGLQEFADMAFVLHLLRPEDLYVDVGAGDGAYAVLAGRCCGAPVVCLEADAERAAHLRRHVTINQIWKRSSIHEVAAGGELRAAEETREHDPGEAGWGLDALGKMEMVTVDSLLTGRQPALLRIGAKGAGATVLAGAARTLASERLLAVLVREPGPEVGQALRRWGFARRYYDPMERRLRRSERGYEGRNALYVRETGEVARRVSAAVRRQILGVEV